MFSLWLIIGIAAASAVSLTVSGVLIAVHIERRRNRKWMKENNIERSLSHRHRSHLSITDVDFNSLPRPARSLRQSFQRPRSESSRFYATCASQEEIKTFPEGTLMDSVVDPGYIGIGKSQQWLSPSKRSRRKKKIPKLVVSGPIMTDRLSSVTELSEEVRQGTPEPVELPAHRTPKVTPEKDVDASPVGKAAAVTKVNHHQFSVRTVVAAPVDRSEGDSRVNQAAVQRLRSISAGSIVAPPPSIAVPELPEQSHKRDQGTKSVIEPVSSAIVRNHHEASTTSPTFVRTQIDQFNRTSALSRFEIESSEGQVRSRSNLPSLSIDTKSASIRQLPQPQPLRPKSSGNNTPSSEFKVIDASDWNIPRGLRHLVAASPNYGKQYSSLAGSSQPISDPIKSLTAPNSTSSSPLKCSDETSRPSSITSVDLFRLSVVGSPSPDPTRRGHKRQNCVKIKNLQPAEPKKRPSSQLGRLTEMEEDSSILLPSPAKKLVSDVARDEKKVSRVLSRSPPMSLRVKRPGLAASRSASGQSVKSVGRSPISAATTHTVEHADLPIHTTETDSRPLPMARSDLQLNIKKQPSIDFSPASSPFIFDMGSPQRPKSKIQGPRSIPPASLRVRNQTGSPMRRKSSAGKRAAREARAEVLRRSITSRNNANTGSSTSFVDFVRNSPSTSIHTSVSLDYWSSESSDRRKRSNTIAGHQGEISEFCVRPLRRADSRTKAQLLQTPPTHHRSRQSPSNISIWEDASVSGDSPDEEHRSTPSRQLRPSPAPESIQQCSPPKSRQASELIARFEGIENARAKRESYRSEDENTPIRALRVASRKRSQTTSTPTRPHEGIGLGLRFE